MSNFEITYIGNLSGVESFKQSWVQIALGENISVTFKKCIEEVFPLLSDPQYHVDAFIIDIEQLYHTTGASSFDVINTLKTLISCTVHRPSMSEKPIRRQTKIAISVNSNSDISNIKECESLVDKIIIQTDAFFTLTDMQEDVLALINEDRDNHKKLNSLFRKKKKHQNDHSHISLTPRQTQILHIINSRGASNKVIAKLLNISESTVKLHMSAILKKYGLKNRTQLALFSKTNTEV